MRKPRSAACWRAVDGAGRGGGGRGGRLRRLSAARHLRVEQRRLGRRCAANDNTASTPKHVVIEVFGEPGAQATITYLDVNAQPQRVDNARLPWSYDVTTTQPAVFTNVAAQGDSDSLGCRITIDGAVKDERTVNT